MSYRSKAIQQWHGWGWSYGSMNRSILVRSQTICSFLHAHFLWFVRYCLCQQFSRIEHEASGTINIAQLQIVITKNLIWWHQSCQRAVWLSRQGRRKSTSVASNDHGGHLPEFPPTQKRCTYCSKEGKENRTFVICLACDIPLCLVKDRNCFSKHHM